MANAEINKKGIFLTILILASIFYILYSNRDQIKSDSEVRLDSMSNDKFKSKLDGFADLKADTGDEEEKDSDPEIGLKVEYIEDYVLVDDINVFYTYAISTVKNSPPPRFPVLLLHGAGYTSFTWKSLGTLQYLAQLGYFPIAVDLPGFGNTKTEKNINDKADFLLKVIRALPRTERPVLISPSMSGQYALPFIIKFTKETRGIITIAPVCEFGEKDFKKLELPALIFYGTKDIYGQKTSLLLENIPNSTVVKILNGGHPAYLDDHVVFHNQIKKFLNDIRDKKRRRTMKR